MEQKKALVGVIIRADGTVPFDEGCHPDVRAAILTHLTDQGHTVEPIKGTRHLKIQGWVAPSHGQS
jgi:hypothetical protein